LPKAGEKEDRGERGQSHGQQPGKEKYEDPGGSSKFGQEKCSREDGRDRLSDYQIEASGRGDRGGLPKK